MILKLLWFY